MHASASGGCHRGTDGNVAERIEWQLITILAAHVAERKEIPYLSLLV
jgi:hypothetical protein